MNRIDTTNLDSNFAPYYFQLSLSDGLKQYVQKVQKAVAYSLWIRDTYSTSSYKQPLFVQPMNQPQKSPSDEPFCMTDLEIYPDDYSSPLPINGISSTEYNKIKDFYEGVSTGQSKIILHSSLSPEFRRLIEMDLILLLTRPTSRKLLLSFSEYENAFTIMERKEYVKGLDEEFVELQKFFRKREYKAEVDADRKIILFDEESPLIESHLSREINDNKNQFLCPGVHFIGLAHEMTHALHANLFGNNFFNLSDPEKPTISEDFDNLFEQFAITGDCGDKAKHMEINEQQISREFGIPYREDHHGVGDFSPDSHACEILHDKELPVQKAARYGATLNIMHYLQTGGDVNLRFQKGVTLLHEASAIGHLEIATPLINYGAEIDPLTDEGISPLFTCAASKSVDVGVLLMDCGAEINRKILHPKSKKPMTPLSVASKYNPKLACILLDRGADLSDIKTDILENSIESGNVDFVDKLMKNHGMTLNPDEITESFNNAVKNQNFEMALFLLEQGADINRPDFRGRTPLVLSITYKRFYGDVEKFSKKRCEQVDFLLKNGAIPSLIFEYNDDLFRTETAFHAAYRYRDIPLLSLLLEADSLGYLAKDKDGKSIYDYATEENQIEVLDLIKPYISNAIKIKCRVPRGHHLTIRGNTGGLNWEQGKPLQKIDNETYMYAIKGAIDDKIEYKLLLDDVEWEGGSNHIFEANESIEILPNLAMPILPSIFIDYKGSGNLYIRGNGVGMESWNKAIKLETFNGMYFFETEATEEDFEFKIVLNDHLFSEGNNYKFTKGKTMQIAPTF